MAEADDGFLSRWSRRKVAVARGAGVADLPLAPVAAPATAVSAVATAEPARAQSLPGEAGAAARAAQASSPPLPATTPNADAVAPTPTLADAQALTPQSDFSAFVGRAVAPEVRNAAMKKLFADPHFNVMDRLDIYIDDYSQPDPLSPQTLRQMVSAKFLNLVEDEPAEAPGQGRAGSGAPQANAVPDIAPSTSAPAVTPVTMPTESPGAVIPAASATHVAAAYAAPSIESEPPTPPCPR